MIQKYLFRMRKEATTVYELLSQAITKSREKTILVFIEELPDTPV